MSKQVDCKNALLSVWKTQDKCEDAMLSAGFLSGFIVHSVLSFMFFFSPTVLLSAYCQWLPESMHQEVAKSWPPV